MEEKFLSKILNKNNKISSITTTQRLKGDAKNAKNSEMKESKAIHVTKNKIKDDQNLVYQMYGSEKGPLERCGQFNFGSQYDSKKDNEICTCKNVITVRKQQEIRYFSGLPKQIFSYRSSKSFIDIGVGSVKALQRRKVRRVYLPETDDTGVGSSDLSLYVFPRRYPKIAARSSYYGHKRTSSKCVGGILEYNTGSIINEKLSPIVQTQSGATSPAIFLKLNNTEIGSNTVEKKMETIGTQFETEPEGEKLELNFKKPEQKPPVVDAKPVKKVSEQTQKFKYSEEITEDKKKPEVEKKDKEPDKTYSSDSLVQHVHNLENPSDEKHSRTSFPDPMENKLEREYRKMFSTTKSKDSKPSYERPIPEFKSASILKRRFEALRRGVKKDDSRPKKNDSILMSTSKRDIIPTHKDASVTSDPPSLIGRSFSHSKKYVPVQEVQGEHEKNKTSHYKKEEYSAQWQQNITESECQGVKGMFKLWGKKFNFEEEASGKRQATPMPSYDTIKKTEEVKPKIKTAVKKKEGRKFFFFKKKSKDKNKEAYKPKKDVTAGRCEIRDGLVLKIGGDTTTKNTPKISEESNEITRKAWLKKFLTSNIESARSVNVRWNNNMYATSSSTVFELLDSVYKNTGFVIRSRSEITTEESSLYRSYTKHRVNFVQDIEAWMIPKTFPDKPIKQLPLKINSDREIKKKNVEVSVSDQKWFIEKSEAFAPRIEVVLHSKNFIKVEEKKVSSEYLRIEIPKDFFDTSSNESKRNHSSDEEVYKIVEYETNSEIGRGRKAIKEPGYQSSNDIQIIVSFQDSKNLESKIIETVIKRPPTHGDVVIQGSNVNASKKCDVIGVGIITQRDLREIRKPILKIQDDLTDDDSDHSDPVLQLNQKKCEFAESYLQEYYRHWTPLGIDLYSWCMSDSHLRSCSERSLSSYHNQGDGSKSCPNIYDDFQTATVMTSSETTSVCSPCGFQEKCSKTEKFTDKFFKKFKKSRRIKRAPKSSDKRIQPKDSVEVFKRRKIYAASAKSEWVGNCDCEDKLVSVPSIESKGCIVERCPSIECPKIEKPVVFKPRAKSCRKRVSMPDCETMNTEIGRQLAVKKEGILQFKGASCDAKKKIASTCSKHAVVNPVPSCEIPQPPCKVSCEMMKNPACNKPHSPSCNDFPRSPSADESICPKPPLPPSCGPHLQPRCFPPESPCVLPPCPAGLPPCESPPPPCSPPPCSPNSSQKHCTPIPSPPCKKNRSPVSCSKPKSPCATPPCASRPCSSLPPCKRSPECSPDQSQKYTPPCTPPLCPTEPPPCKKPPQPCSPDSSQKYYPPCTPPPCPPEPPTCKKPKSPCSSPFQNSCTHCNDTYCSKVETPSCVEIPSPLCKKHHPSLSCSTQSILPRKKPKSPCTLPPCLPVPPSCKKSPPPCPNPYQKSCSHSSDTYCSKIETPSCVRIPPPTCKKHRSSLSCSKQSVCSKTKPKSPCPTPSPPCKNLSPPHCRKPSPPSCNKPSPRCTTPSPCKKQCASPSCRTQCTPSPCKKPSLLSSILPWKKSNSFCQKSCSPIKTRCSLPKPCPSIEKPCPPPVCPMAAVPCKKSPFLPTPCTKLLKPLKAQPCKTNPGECCYNYSSCRLSCHEIVPHARTCSKHPKPGKCKCCETPSSCSCQIPPCETKKVPPPCAPPPCPPLKKAPPPCPPPKKVQPPCAPPPCPPAKKIQPPCAPSQKSSCESISSCPSPKKVRSSCLSLKRIQPPCGSPQSRNGISLRQCPSPPKPPKGSPCRVPPCDQYIKRLCPLKRKPRCEQNTSQECPWHKNSPISNQPSHCSPPAEPKPSHQCHKNCSMIPSKQKCSLQYLSPNMEDECQPHSPQLLRESISNMSYPGDPYFSDTNNCPHPYPSKSNTSPSCLPIGTRSKVSGLYLKMKPSRKKTCSPECLAWEKSEKLQGVIKLCSHEKLTVKIRQQTPSTEEIREEIREPMNIKVKDEDGRTLYERKDYTRGAQCHSMLGDLYRESKINRVTTPTTVMAADENKKDLSAYKSDESVANLIEINFKLRVTQGDKTTEVNIGNENDEKQNTRAKIRDVNPEIFIIKNEAEEAIEDVPKNDINIKITVRNLKPKHFKVQNKPCNDKFSKKISDKFHTVSTGYSTLAVDENEDHVFSIHRATINLCSSADITSTQSKISNEVPSKEFIEYEPNLTVSSHSTEQIPTDITEDENIEGKSISSKKDSQSEKIEETNTNESELPDFNDTDEQDAALLGLNTSNECNVESVMSRHTSEEEKKLLLKKVLQKAGRTQGKNKESIRELRDMLKIILTDSSDYDDTNITSNELVKDVTYTSLKPNYFRDTDSMNNYYQLESALSSIKDSKIEAIYPTAEENSQASERSSDSDANDITFKGCMCTKIAERLNQPNMKIGCCCRQKLNKDEETNCDLRNDIDLFLLNYKTAEYVDVVTQNSNYLCGKVKSLNVSVHSKNTSIDRTIDDIKVVEKFKMIQSPKVSKRLSKISQRRSIIRECEMNKLYQNTAISISDDDQNINVLSRKSTKLSTKLKRKKDSIYGRNNENYLLAIEPDILQSYAVKKAVLEIYAEKNENGEHFVAKLPKFVSDKESEIVNNYEQIATNSYKSICRQNIVMMSV